MEYIAGEVDKYLIPFDIGPERDKVIQRVALDMFDAIEQLHSRCKFIHRDIKPENFMIKRDRAIVIDFGLATEWFKDGAHIREEKNQQMQGTLRYASLWTHEGII